MAYSEAVKEQLRAEAQERVAAADGGDSSTLARQRIDAEKYYRGDPFGDEVTGRSQVVSRDVAQYVDSQMPSLMRVFASGDEVVVFEPTGPEDVEGARQATDYVNWIWRQNDGFLRFHHWFKDGLLFKLGVVKVWWDDTPKVTRERYRGLTDAQLQSLQGDADIEVGEVETQTIPGPEGLIALHDVAVVKTNRGGRVKAMNVPPEEFRFGQRTRDDSESSVFAHVRKMPRGELIAMGYPADEVVNLSGGSDGDNDAQKIERFRDVDDGRVTTASEDDVEVVEAYFRYALEDDEAPRHWMVTYSGSTVLACEEVDDHPFACVTPILMPHRLVGLSTADQTMDIQRAKSTIQRQMLDNMYLQNMPQIGAVEGQANLDDLLTRRTGGVVRLKNPNALVPIPTTPLGQEPYQMIEYLDTQGEQRTGATRYNQGIDANSLNKTASGINLIQNAAAQRLELIARVYAETGVKRAFRRILSLVQKHQTAPQMIRLRGQWVPMDPRGWSTSMDMTVTVGLGNGNKDQTLAHIMTLLQLDQQIVTMQGGVNGPLVTAENIYNKLKKLIEAAGLRSVEPYYTDPADPKVREMMAQQPPKPDPKMVEVQGKLEVEKMQAQARLASDAAKAQQDMQHAQQNAALEERLALMKAETEAQIEREKAALQAELAQQKAALDVAEMQAKAEADRRAEQFDMIHEAIRSHNETVLQDRRDREEMARARQEEAAATEHARRAEEEEAMARGPSDEYRAMATMAQAMMQVVERFGELAEAQQKTQADTAAALKRLAAPRRLVKDESGTRSEIVE